jgi:ABC-type bacteriocin/lantibiotic exporter with double-glycine peptidase domain
MDTNSIKEKWYLEFLYNLTGGSDMITFLLILSISIFIFFLFKNFISLIILYIQSRFSFNISLRLSQKMFQHYYDQGYLYISDQDTGKKNYDVIIVPYYFASSYLMETLLMSTEIVVLLLIFISLIIYNPIAIVFLIIFSLPILAIIYQLTKNKTKALGEARNTVAPKAISVLIDSMNAYNDVVLTNKEQSFYENFSDQIKKLNSIDALQQGIFAKIHQRLNDIVLGLGLMVLLAYAYFFRENSSEILVLMSVFALAAYRMLPAINRIMGSALAIKNVSYVIDELKVLNKRRLKHYKTVDSLHFNEKIVFDRIGFSYPGTDVEVLKDISFHLHKGETIGFIGSSGSGKTTILHLFLRFLKENKGSIFLDSLQLGEDNKASFQKMIGYVQQNVYIRNGTLRENIAFGQSDNEIDEIKLKKAVSDAMLTEIVESHPEGIDIYLG